MNIQVRRQENLDIVEKRDFRRRELLVKYTVKILYGWDNKKFENKYWKKIRNSKKGKIRQYKTKKKVSLGVKTLKEK